MATATEIDLAFRFLLGRPPNEEEARTGESVPVEALRSALMATEEFRSALPGDAVLMRLDHKAPPIVWVTDGPTTAALLAKVQAHWTQLGQQRPHWSADNRDEFAPENIAANLPLFEASGEGDVATLLAMLARHGLSPERLPHLVDFGCGVGRMTRPLARVFRHVTGCDVSAPHLALARMATGAGVNFALVGVPDFGMTAPFDIWFSTLTLQHNPPPVITMILRRMFSLLAPGGVAVFQLPTDRVGYGFDPASYLAAPDGPAMEIHVLPQSVVFALAAEAGCVALEVREDGLVWPPTLCVSNNFIFAKPFLSGPAGMSLGRR